VTTSGTASISRGFRQWSVVGILLIAGLGGPVGVTQGAASPAAGKCTLTQGNFGDPNYKANAPIRSRVGTGFVLSGIVRSGIDCSSIPGARVEFWLRGPNGQYDDAHRGTVVADGTGRYRFESNVPAGNTGLQPHIHLRIAVPGYRTLVTIFFPGAGAAAGTLDLVLEPDV
jgi:protocatechuate 3,4-dioxygenase beta subunit